MTSYLIRQTRSFGLFGAVLALVLGTPAGSAQVANTLPLTLWYRQVWRPQ